MVPVLAACFIACIISATGGAPTFEKGFESVVAEEDAFLQVLCSARGDRPMYYNWYDQNEQNITSKVSNDTYSYTTYNGSWLIIPKTRIDHQGIYVCTANNANGLSSKLFNISIAPGVSPVFDRESESVVAEENSYFEISCSATGVRPIFYYWSDRYGQNITSVQNNDTYSYTTYNGSWLVIPRANASHEGTYNCTAYNNKGVSTKVYNISVIPGGSPTFDDDYEYVKAVEFSYFEVLCSARGVPPIYYSWSGQYGQNISWNSNDTIHTYETYSGSWLIIPNVNKSHEGYYYCSARNEQGYARKRYYIGVVDRDSLMFDRDYEYVKAEEFSYLNVLCSARGVRPIYYNWSDPYDRIISSDDNNTIYTYENYNGSWLIIPNVNKSQEGIYNCSARNEQGYAKKMYYIHVVENSGNDTNATAAIVSFRAVTVTNSSVLFDIRTVGRVGKIHFSYCDNFSNRTVFGNYWRVGLPYEVRNLNAGASYSFEFGLPGDHTWTEPYRVVLLPAAPEIIFRGLKDGTVQVEWFRSLESIRRGTIDKHVISYYTVWQIGNSWKPGDCATSIEIPSCSTPKYTIADLSKGIYYEISVRAHTESGFGSATYHKVYIA